MPKLAVQPTDVLKFPVPCTVALHWLVCPDWIVDGEQVSLTEVMVVDTGFTVMVVEADFVGSCTDVAVMVTGVVTVTVGAV